MPLYRILLVLGLAHLIPEFADRRRHRPVRFGSRSPDALLSHLHGVAMDQVVGLVELSQAKLAPKSSRSVARL